jgi:hypothetical protein
MMSGAEHLIDWMKRRGFNFTEAAEYLGWDLTFVSKLANGHRLPGLTNAIHLERCCGIPVEAWVSSELDSESEAVPAGRKTRR